MLVRLRWLAIAAGLIGYPLLAHYTTGAAHNPRLGALVALAPAVAIGVLFAWHSARRSIMLGGLVLACAILAAFWPLLEGHFGLVYWLQNTAMQLILLMTFGRTLIAGRQPLCTRFAEALYGPVSSEHRIYTRQVTIAWSIFFAALAAISTLLFFLAPLPIWSIFANFLTLPLVAVMFLAEFAVRKRMLPDIQQMHLLDAVRAFTNDSARPR